jgi:hypothetical protein
LAEGFQRRRLKCEKLTDNGRQGELKRWHWDEPKDGLCDCYKLKRWHWDEPKDGLCDCYKLKRWHWDEPKDGLCDCYKSIGDIQ